MDNETRFCLTLDEATGYWWINDELTGKTYYTDQKDVAIAREVLADHILYSTEETTK